MGFLDKLLGSTSEAQVKKLMPMVKRINELEVVEWFPLSAQAEFEPNQYPQNIWAEAVNTTCARPCHL